MELTADAKVAYSNEAGVRMAQSLGKQSADQMLPPGTAEEMDSVGRVPPTRVPAEADPADLADPARPGAADAATANAAPSRKSRSS